VVLDVVYNHFGPSDLDLWQFDGWSENNLGGIYFYNDWKSETPWGNTRPDYGRGEVRQFIRDNALMWLDEFHMDGLRFDMSLYIRSVRGDETDPGDDLPDGWSLTQWINREVRENHPGKFTIAEDLRNNQWLTQAPQDGGAGFHAQWDARFVHPVRAAVIPLEDRIRDMSVLADAISFRYNGDAFQRVVYSESHDEIANGKQRVPSEISPQDPDGFYAQKRSVLAALLVFTAPGVPMLFQGQEFLEAGWFRDDVPLDWDKSEEFRGILLLYRDLIALRLNRRGFTRGLCGQGLRVHHVENDNNVLAFHRWDQGGPGDDVVVALNLSNQALPAYRIGFPKPGAWKLRLNTDWQGYSQLFTGAPSGDLSTDEQDCSGCSSSAIVSLAPYSGLIYSQDPQASQDERHSAKKKAN
jgi:1,4-alpha-glucan branching enzyme